MHLNFLSAVNNRTIGLVTASLLTPQIAFAHDGDLGGAVIMIAGIVAIGIVLLVQGIRKSKMRGSFVIYGALFLLATFGGSIAAHQLLPPDQRPTELRLVWIFVPLLAAFALHSWIWDRFFPTFAGLLVYGIFIALGSLAIGYWVALIRGTPFYFSLGIACGTGFLLHCVNWYLQRRIERSPSR